MQNLDKLISELKKAKESLRADKKEPHKDDPRHEQKEQEKAKKIKKEAQNLLDLHKEETNGMAAPAPAPAASPGAPNMSKADSIALEQQKANRAKAESLDKMARPKDQFGIQKELGHEVTSNKPRFRDGATVTLKEAGRDNTWHIHESHPDGDIMHYHVPRSEVNEMLNPEREHKLSVTGHRSDGQTNYNSAIIKHHGFHENGKPENKIYHVTSMSAKVTGKPMAKDEDRGRRTSSTPLENIPKATPGQHQKEHLPPKEIVKSQEVFDELVKNGHTESALLLKNWGEEDALAKSYREYLTKSKKPDSVGTNSYSDKEIKAARSAVDAAGTEDNHVKLFNNANSHYGTHASDGDHAGGSNDMVHDNYQQSLAHYHKTGKALKFGKDTGEATGATIRAGVKARPGHIPLKEVRVPKISGPKGKLP